MTKHGADVQPHRAIAHTTTTAGAPYLIDLVYPVDVLVAQALTGAFHPGWSRVMAGGLKRISSEHARIPVAHAFSALGFVNDVEAETGGAEEGTNATAQATLRNSIPVRAAKVLLKLFFQMLGLESNLHPVEGFLLDFVSRLDCAVISILQRGE